MFSKIDKKVLIILIAVLIVLLLVVWAGYRAVFIISPKVDNSAGGVQIEAEDDSKNLQIDRVETEVSEKGRGGLIVCASLCGDGTCQTEDPYCGEDNNLNCICEETPQNCPKDCN